MTDLPPSPNKSGSTGVRPNRESTSSAKYKKIVTTLIIIVVIVAALVYVVTQLPLPSHVIPSHGG